MAKLTSMEKERFSINREIMLEENINWAFCRETGITIVYKGMPTNKFVKLSIAYCNEKDVFKKKIGLNTAMGRWSGNESIQIPNVACGADCAIYKFVSQISKDKAMLEWVE